MGPVGASGAGDEAEHPSTDRHGVPLRSMSTASTLAPEAEGSKGMLGLNLLHASNDPQVDLIFIHGLGGGSRISWSKTNAPEYFWPQAWLPFEPGLERTRIYSYGYGSDWLSTHGGDIKIQDFAKSLVGAIADSPSQRHGSKTGIILICHSMGGLVGKKAYMLARQDPRYAEVASKIFAMIFIGTPHRGVDTARMLNLVLKATIVLGTKAFIGSLQNNSSTLEDINEDFRHYAGGLRLRSFYETKETKLGFRSHMIVDKASATLGYPGETSTPLDADHRGTNKFLSPSDPNYISLRNAIGTLVEEVTMLKEREDCDAKAQELSLPRRTAVEKGLPDSTEQRVQQLEDLLSIEVQPHEDLQLFHERRMEGSCSWLTDKKSFTDWIQPQASELKDNAASLRRLGHNKKMSGPGTSNDKFFLLHGKPAMGKSFTASQVIDSLGEQDLLCSFFFFQRNDKRRSKISTAVRSMAFQMAQLDHSVLHGLRSIVDNAAQIEHEDARCMWRILFTKGIMTFRDTGMHYWVFDALDEASDASLLISLLADIPQDFPLKVFMTTRSSPDLEKRFKRVRPQILIEEMSVGSTSNDIDAYVTERASTLPIDDAEARQRISRSIIAKASGCFLWVSLVMDELENAFSLQDIERIIHEIPENMSELYERILHEMVAENKNTVLARAILTWTVCARRPLTIKELATAITMDTGESLTSLPKAIEALCGNLIRFESSGQVKIIHHTAVEYLLQPDSSPNFRIDYHHGHGRLAEATLKALSRNDLRPPKIVRPDQPPKSRFEGQDDFLYYASRYFSEHVRRTDTASDSILAHLHAFFSCNVLSWIEYVAASGNIQQLLDTADDLDVFLKRRTKHYAPLGNAVQHLERWTTDLRQVTTKFGRRLTNYPWTIYQMVPAFCPSKSAIASPMTRSSLSTGITICGISNDDWSDRIACLDHLAKLKAVACSSDFLAIGLSTGTIMVYDANTCQFSFSLEGTPRLRLLQFNASGTKLAAASTSSVTLWDLENEEHQWTVSVPSEPLALIFNNGDANLATFTVNLSFFQCDTTSLQCSEPHAVISTFEDRSQGHKSPALAIIPSKELNVVAVVKRGAPISFHDLETLGIVNTSSKAGDVVQGLGFRGSQTLISGVTFCRNPALSLVAVSYFDGDLSVFDPFGGVDSHTATVEEIYADSLASSPSGHILAAGSSTGIIDLYDFETLHRIYRIEGLHQPVRALTFSADGTRLFDARGSECNGWAPSTLLTRRHEFNDSETLDSEPVAHGTVAKFTAAPPINSIAAHPNGEIILCGTEAGAVSVFSATTGHPLGNLLHHAHKTAVIAHLLWTPKGDVIVSGDHGSCVVVSRVERRGPERWAVVETLLNRRCGEAIRQLDIDADGKVLRVTIGFGAQQRALFWTLDGGEAPHDNASFVAAASSAQLTADAVAYPGLAAAKHVMGFCGGRAVFLDNELWVNVVGPGAAEPERLVFVPEEWVSANPKLLCCVTGQGDIVFVRGHEVAVLKTRLRLAAAAAAAA